MIDQELEAKFYIKDLDRIERRLQSLEAECVQKRVLETNLRFDTEDRALSSTFQVLRLRQDTEARLTYKGPSEFHAGARLRKEIEFTVSDFGAARRLFEALGYTVSMMYEKYRTTYDLKRTHVTLDELPYGHFVEIEGQDSNSIHEVAALLELEWENRAPDSYTGLFERLRQSRGLPFTDLSFANFQGLEVKPEEMGVLPAD
jgi:adenylate cyclase class 2